MIAVEDRFRPIATALLGHQSGSTIISNDRDADRPRADHLAMLNASSGRRMKAIYNRFVADDRGSVMILFAVSLVVMLYAVGGAIDFTRAFRARTQMQAALDAAALILAKDASSGVITSSQISSKATPYFNANFRNTEVQAISIGVEYSTQKGTSVTLTGSGSIQTYFLGIAGFATLPVNASSTATLGAGLLRIALVLDVTASMNDNNKIGALRTAALNLVTKLAGLATNNGDLYISVIPFAEDVNVGISNVNAPWLRWDLWDPSNYPDSSNVKKTWCRAHNWMTMAFCLGHDSTWNHAADTSNTAQWNGCVTDRDQNYDTTSTPPTSYSTQFIADQDESCPQPIVPLSYNWSLIQSTISSMTATSNGSTNQPIGLLWGWLSLLQQSPLNAPPERPGSTYQHIIVLLTDGLNTWDRWYGDGSNTSSQVDARQKLLCDSIKATAITIYTIQVDTSGDGVSPVLPYCASDARKFYMLTNPNQMSPVFDAIGTSISQLRIAK